MLQGAIYHMIKSDERSKDLHDSGTRVENRPFKLFVFSDLIGQFRYNPEKKVMNFDSNAYFEVSSIQENFMIEIVKHLQTYSDFYLGKQKFQIIDFQIIDPLIKKDKNKKTFTTISPITVYRSTKEKTVYFSPTHPEFLELIHQNIIKKFQAVEMVSTITIPEVEVLSFEKRSVYYRDHFVVCYNMRFSMEKLSHIYETLMLDTGLGSKNSMGFGMIRRED